MQLRLSLAAVSVVAATTSTPLAISAEGRAIHRIVLKADDDGVPAAPRPNFIIFLADDL
eukprot:SAG31_NODE_22404_length_526_cov_1.086651_1_plen_58_part_01